MQEWLHWRKQKEGNRHCRKMKGFLGGINKMHKILKVLLFVFYLLLLESNILTNHHACCHCKERTYTQTYTLIIAFLITMSCWIQKLLSSLIIAHHSLILYWRTLRAQDHWSLAAPGWFPGPARCNESLFPQHDATRSSCCVRFSEYRVKDRRTRGRDGSEGKQI